MLAQCVLQNFLPPKATQWSWVTQKHMLKVTNGINHLSSISYWNLQAKYYFLNSGKILRRQSAEDSEFNPVNQFFFTYPVSSLKFQRDVLCTPNEIFTRIIVNPLSHCLCPGLPLCPVRGFVCVSQCVELRDSKDGSRQSPSLIALLV